MSYINIINIDRIFCAFFAYRTIQVGLGDCLDVQLLSLILVCNEWSDGGFNSNNSNSNNHNKHNETSHSGSIFK